MVSSLLDYLPGTVMLGIQSDGTLRVTMADDTIQVDLDQVNRELAAEADRLRARGQLDGEVAPLAEVDGHLVLDDDHVYRLLRRDRHHLEVGVYERVH